MQGPGEHRREREAGRLVYPVISRRSGGLSLGINLFPEAKVCSFDCPYCEVFLPSGPGGDFSLRELGDELDGFLARGRSAGWAGEIVRDICFSGNGEPTLSPFLEGALDLCAGARRALPGILAQAALVLITNSTGFLDPAVCALLERFSRDEGLVIWAKLDAGSEPRFGLMAGRAGSLEPIAAGLLAFARRAPVVVQTMLCSVDGSPPSDAEVEDYAALLHRLVSEGARIDEAHLYTYARPSPGGRCAALSDAELGRHAAFVRGATGLRVRAFGSLGEVHG
jgi:wyosine [tRNA(Phe)-imidazoG37] synthetase (radical SAM superfamily)